MRRFEGWVTAWSLLTAALLSLPLETHLAGQTAPLASSDLSAASAPSVPASTATKADRQVSPKLLPVNIIKDQKPIWLFPFHVAQGNHWKPALATMLATAGLVALDPHDAPYFRRTSTFRDFNKVVSGGNTTLTMAIVPASVYVVGIVRRDSYAQHTALLAGEAVADSALLTVVMKDIDRRLRPSDISPNGDFSHPWFKCHSQINGAGCSFPSGHTIAAFSLATVFAERYHQHRWMPWVAYGMASLV